MLMPLGLRPAQPPELFSFATFMTIYIITYAIVVVVLTIYWMVATIRRWIKR